MKLEPFKELLRKNLESSSITDRKKWADIIHAQKFEINNFVYLLDEKDRIASRFLWLLSEVGESYPTLLLSALPLLLDYSDNYPLLKAALPTYWNIVGLPVENEAKGIDLLFNCINSNNINVTIKSRAIFALHQLVIKYPDLKHEFQAVLNTQLKKYSKDFDNRILKVLHQLN